MRIFDIHDNEIQQPDLELGYLQDAQRIVAQHPAIEAVEEVFHYEYADYPNGGSDRRKVIDVEAVEAAEAWTEYEDILRYIEYEPQELQLRDYEKARAPMTANDVLLFVLPPLLNALTVDDNTAVRMKQFYPKFENLIGQTLVLGNRFTYADELWEVIQPSLMIQEQYAPGTGMESLYKRIDETHSGTEADPIPYKGNMALENGKYYYQNGALYLCNRDTGNPVYHTLEELRDLYVELVWRKTVGVV